jgi:hypothetical protein
VSSGLKLVVGGKTYMPEFPPVTMNTLPVRSGRVFGLKGMFDI